MADMLSYALSTGTHFATSYFHLPFDEEEDADIENYERKYVTWVAEPSGSSSTPSSENSTPWSSSPSSPTSSRTCLSSSSSSASISSLGSQAPSISSTPSAPHLNSKTKSHSKSSSSSSTSSTASTSSYPPSTTPKPEPHSSSDHAVIDMIINDNDLYSILGVSKSATLDKMTLRHAYLARSKACHPDKFPDNPSATEAFQKVAVAYDVLSTPALKRRYDSRSPSSPYDVFSARPTGYAEETLRSVILGVFNDFLDGDLEVIRSLLKAINDVNPGIRLGDEGINSVLASLHAIRERALTCRICIYALHNELMRLLEVQHAFSQLSYFDILGRTRLTIQLTRITLRLPITLEQALLEQGSKIRSSDADGRRRSGCDEFRERGACFHDVDGVEECGDRGKEKASTGFPRHVMLLIRGIDVALEGMEKILK